MYCSVCGIQIGQGLSFCNRCGASLKDRSDSRTGAITAFLTAITLIGVIGLGIMVGGALTLRRVADLNQDLVGLFLLMTFLITCITEVLLVKQLSRITGEKSQPALRSGHAPAAPSELPPAQMRALAEPVASVTENTTRTLEYSRSNSSR